VKFKIVLLVRVHIGILLWPVIFVVGAYHVLLGENNEE
jgi:hypothetical protein